MKDNKLSTIGTTTQINYQALEYVSWFDVDSNNVQTLCSSIFRGGDNTTDSNFQLLLQAAIKSIQETESDIAKIKEFLGQIVPPNNV